MSRRPQLADKSRVFLNVSLRCLTTSVGLEATPLVTKKLKPKAGSEGRRSKEVP